MQTNPAGNVLRFVWFIPGTLTFDSPRRGGRWGRCGGAVRGSDEEWRHDTTEWSVLCFSVHSAAPQWKCNLVSYQHNDAHTLRLGCVLFSSACVCLCVYYRCYYVCWTSWNPCLRCRGKWLKICRDAHFCVCVSLGLRVCTIPRYTLNKLNYFLHFHTRLPTLGFLLARACVCVFSCRFLCSCGVNGRYGYKQMCQLRASWWATDWWTFCLMVFSFGSCWNEWHGFVFLFANFAFVSFLLLWAFF